MMTSTRMTRAAGILLLNILIVFVSIQGPARSQSRSKIVCYTSFDDEFFYLAAVVDKPALAGTTTGLFGDPTLDDAIAVFLQAEDQPAGLKRSKRSIEMAVSVAGGVQLYRSTDATPLRKPDDFLKNSSGRPITFKYGITPRGKVGENGGPDTGYMVELAIPWAEIGGAPTSGQQFRFNVIAYSAAKGTSPIVSLSPTVKSPDDVQNPSLWAEAIFVDAPARSVASAPLAKVVARVINNKPLIDGALSPSEWNGLTAFGFAETTAGTGSASFVPSLATARIRPKTNLKPATAPIPIRASSTVVAPARNPQPIPRLVLSLFRYSFQNDTRKSSPVQSVRTDDGASILANHPMSGDGPWMTYDRLDWHRNQLYEMRRSGIDVALPVFRTDEESSHGYARRGLMVMSAALKSLRNSGYEYPLLGLYLDTSSFGGKTGEKIDLRQEAGKAALYRTIKEFYNLVPRDFRLSVQLDQKNGSHLANLVILNSSSGFAGLDDSFVDYCRSHFLTDFGADLIVLGGADFKPHAKLDGYVEDTHGRGFRMEDGGWIKSAAIGAGSDDLRHPASAESFRSRDDGNTYRDEWRQALAKKPDWVFLDGWNDFDEGSEIAPSLEYGVQFVDQTRVYSRAFAGNQPWRAQFLNHDIPNSVASGSKYRITVRIANAGASTWTPETNALVYRWLSGSPSRGSSSTIPLQFAVIPGQSVNHSFDVVAPTAPGDYSLVIDAAQIGKKGDVTALFGGIGGTMLTVPITVKSAANGSDYGASVVQNDLPGALETGGAYRVRVTLRNDGTAPWKRGDRVTARLAKSAAQSGADNTLPMADASAEIPSDVPPGQTVAVTVPITFAQAGGSPLPPWSQTDDWTYQIRWEVAGASASDSGAVTDPETIALVESDAGAVFIRDVTPTTMPGNRRIPVKIGIRNNGPQTWKKDVTRIGYHWYYLDGVEAVWEDETTPLTQDLEPGAEAPDMLAWITAPPNEGTYWLVWDLKVGDAWISTLPSSRPSETMLHQIEVVHGKTTYVDLSKSFNLDGISSDLNRGDGNFDGTGRTLPSELIPPFATGESAPSTLWLPANRNGIESPRRFAFKWGPKGDKEKNVIQCIGQTVPLIAKNAKPEVFTAIHLLAAATKDDAPGAFTIQFDDGAQQLTSFPVSRWDGAPGRGEEIAFRARRTHTPSSEASDKPVQLYHYVIKIGEAKKLSSIVLPNNPDIKIAAITLQK